MSIRGIKSAYRRFWQIPLIALATLMLFGAGVRHGWAETRNTSEGQTHRLATVASINSDGESHGGTGVQPSLTGEDPSSWTGLVLLKPANGVGTWLIQTETAVTQTVTADNATRFDKGLPSEGDWVEVEGTLQPDKTILASRIRPDEYQAGEVVVRLAPNAISSTVASKYNLVPKSTLLSSGHIYLFGTQGDDETPVVQDMQNDPDVVWAELNYVNSIPEDSGYKTWGWGGVDPTGYVDQHAFQQIGLISATHTYQGNNVVVAVLDTGVDLQHWEFRNRLLPGLDVVADDTVPQDEGNGLAWGHGTHVAGIIARVAPQSRILPVRVLDTNGRGNTFLLAYAIEWAADHGANVINLSLGTNHDSNVLREAIKQATDRGVVVVAAAGNSNQDIPQYPAAYNDVLAVTAVDGQNVKASFANYGHGWVKLAAPGVGITSTIIGPLGSGYASWSGTSMSTAFVSGAAALARQKVARGDVNAIDHLLLSTAGNLDTVNPTYQDELGGLLNVYAALGGQEQPKVDSRSYLYLPVLLR